MKCTKFVQTPNLPAGLVSTVIVSRTCTELVQKLRLFNIACLHPDTSHLLQAPTANHADMLTLHLGDNNMAIAEGQENLNNHLAQLEFQVLPEQPLAPEYPADCGLNALIINNYVVAKKEALGALASTLECNGYHVIDTKQGYARCSTAVVASNAVITADKNIARIMHEINVNCLLVPQGEIELSGYCYGFIGGTCGKLSDKLLAFTGSINGLSYYGQLNAFCKKHDVETIALTHKPLFDIGGILPIAEH